MIATKGYAAQSATEDLGPYNFQRREPGEHDVQLEILYCGVCHSDLHQARNEWQGTIYPVVPGHEIIGRITKLGSAVKKFKVGQTVGIGCMVGSCRECNNCQQGLEQYCENGFIGTYNGTEKGNPLPTYGGYSNQIVADEYFVLSISDKLPLEGVAPLLCAGITTYSPLRHWGVGKGHKVGVVGLGGLGHMAVKLAASFGAEVTMFSTSPQKEDDAKKLGAHHFALTKDPSTLKKLASHFDFIVDTVSAPHNYNSYLEMLGTDGVMICVGVPPSPTEILGFNLIANRRSIGGSLIGGIPETQEMLDYCAEHNIVSDVEVIDISYINKAYERMLKGDVKYRFVIDMKSL
jgi:alcohol dehydrogenase (NADP+)